MDSKRDVALPESPKGALEDFLEWMACITGAAIGCSVAVCTSLVLQHTNAVDSDMFGIMMLLAGGIVGCVCGGIGGWALIRRMNKKRAALPGAIDLSKTATLAKWSEPSEAITGRTTA